MAKTRGDQLSTGKGKLVGKEQLYALLVDSAGNAILDAAGNEQLSEVKVGTDGKLLTASTITGSLPNQTLVEQKTQADAIGGIVTFSENIQAIGIYNTDASHIGLFTVNGINITIPTSQYAEFVVGGTPGKTITVSSSTSYIISRFI